MQLEELWKKYSSYDHFNLSVLPESIRAQGVRVTFPPRSVIISRGDSPDYIYFFEEGTALGTRDYNDGNNYYYFRITKEDGCLGLLEVLSHHSRIVATVVASTEVTALRVSSALVYEYIMSDPAMLRSCLRIVARDLYQRSGNDGIFYYQRGIDRVRYYLVQYCNLHRDGDRPILIQPDYQTIASNIGVSVRTVVRSIRSLKESGEITSEKKKISVSREQYRILLDAILPLLHG